MNVVTFEFSDANVKLMYIWSSRCGNNNTKCAVSLRCSLGYVGNKGVAVDFVVAVGAVVLAVQK